MTDKEIIEVLGKIKENCEIHDCDNCVFGVNAKDAVDEKYHYNCQINDLTGELMETPNIWDMRKIGEIINE